MGHVLFATAVGVDGVDPLMLATSMVSLCVLRRFLDLVSSRALGMLSHKSAVTAFVQLIQIRKLLHLSAELLQATSFYFVSALK